MPERQKRAVSISQNARGTPSTSLGAGCDESRLRRNCNGITTAVVLFFKLNQTEVRTSTQEKNE